MRINLVFKFLLILFFYSNAVQASDLAMPLGIELGTTTCADMVSKKGSGWNLVPANYDRKWNNGAELISKDVDIKGLELINELAILCNSRDSVIEVILVIPNYAINSFAESLNKKYKLIRNDFSENAFPSSYSPRSAIWMASNAEISIFYKDLFSDATLSYKTEESKRLWNEYFDAKRRKEKGALDQSL